METKTKFRVEIEANGTHNDAIIRMITNHNAGKCELSFAIISGFIKADYCQWTTIRPNTEIKEVTGPNNYMEIREEGKHTLTIQCVEVRETSSIDLRKQPINQN